ncbi:MULTISPECIES: glycosyltransferase family A protein [Moorena]|uniref:Putative glycosyltransferase n=1 Tax=Moorena producens 3L TaxID=489825 RepID=F4Y0B6_9CYAN|nr:MULTISPECIES: glycosyltransferase family A protein [Moorena]NEQ16185.1 glycosyltransferase family 2 protein [Moorena sp. SIO3E2]EGJ29706.1 putative glycosyltransferase [Moorena producens 3L]NEP34237.1 glycosyltransferase family 2 protein [Moorena sp. SIO3B2]NEP68165.1 glycosyltransferase family 2 protein [Moorena sp. SIO3A5]NEQ06869.1 glycosyltransferase family 2 protein [Moorena sp. SIO4E2]
MKFSVVITTYNRLDLLKRAIESALAQTFPCEIVIVDNGSSDGTEGYVQERSEALARAGEHSLVYHRNSDNMGHSKAVNQGVELATGDWIKLLDDDDYLAKNCIEEMANAIALHPKAVICSCQSAQVNTLGVELSITRRVGSPPRLYIAQEDIHYGMLLEMVPFGTPAQVAFSRDGFLSSGGWDSSLDTNFDDIDSWIRIAQFGDAIFINKCLAYRTVWSGAYNQKFSFQKRLKTHISIKQKIYELVSEKYQGKLPLLWELGAYLRLHWGLVALKRGKLISAAKLLFPECFSPIAFSPIAWKLLLLRKTLGYSPELYHQLPL